MSTELATYQPQTALSEQMDYAKAVSAGSLLPRDYQNNPANVLIAVGLGQSMGLSPAESLYRITVIQGKPTASAELIAANVRKAGHKLRVRGDDKSATAQIVRADDPDYTFEVTRDIKWAQQMKLTDKDNYKKQPGTMLQWRAITAVARLACPEALYGVVYSSDEIADERPSHTADQRSPGLGAALAAQQPDPEPPITDRTRKALFALMSEVGIDAADDQSTFLTDTLGRDVASRSTLTEAEGVAAGKRLRAIQQGDPDAEWVPTFDAEITEPAEPELDIPSEQP